METEFSQKNQLFRIKAENNEIPVGNMGIMNCHARILLKRDAVNKARSLPGAEF